MEKIFQKLNILTPLSFYLEEQPEEKGNADQREAHRKPRKTPVGMTENARHLNTFFLKRRENGLLKMFRWRLHQQEITVRKKTKRKTKNKS